MLKHFSLPLLLLVLTISGCQKSQKSSSTSYQGPIYEEVSQLHIHWDDLFNQEQEKYFVYVYSVTCTPCSMLREEIIDFSLNSGVNFYFVNPNDDIPFVDDAAIADASINATSIENVCCYSTPTLMEIKEKVITYYSRDYYEIKELIDSYK